MSFNLYITPTTSLILILFTIFFGQVFRKNWKDKKNNWVLKSWIYGVVSSTSFFILILASYEIQP